MRARAKNGRLNATDSRFVAGIRRNRFNTRPVVSPHGEQRLDDLYDRLSGSYLHIPAKKH
jgi:hypothetical protein